MASFYIIGTLFIGSMLAVLFYGGRGIYRMGVAAGKADAALWFRQVQAINEWESEVGKGIRTELSANKNAD